MMKVRFRRRISNAPNLMQISQNNRFFSLAVNSAHVSKMPATTEPNLAQLNLFLKLPIWKFVLDQLWMIYNNSHLGIWRSDTGMSWSRSMVLVGDIAKSLLVFLATTNIWGGAQSNVINLHFVSEVRHEVVRDVQLELFSLSDDEKNIIFCSPFGLLLVIFAPLDRGDEIVAEK